MTYFTEAEERWAEARIARYMAEYDADEAASEAERVMMEADSDWAVNGENARVIPASEVRHAQRLGA